MPFQKGNTLARGRRSPKAFRDMLILVLNEPVGDKTKLRVVASKLVEMAMDGDMWAIREIADRLDGKPAQMVYMDTNTLTHPKHLTGAELDARINETIRRLENGEFDELEEEDA